MGSRVLPVDEATVSVVHSIWLEGPKATASRIGARGYSYAPFAQVGDAIAIEPHLLVLYVEGRTTIERRIDRVFEHEEVGPGDLSLQSTLMPAVWNWQRPIEVLHVYISSAHLREMARRSFASDVSGVKLRNRLRIEDSKLQELGFDLISELRQPARAGADIAARAIGDRLLVELLRNHADLERSDSAFDETTTGRLREHIEAHIGDRLELPMLARVAGYGVHHFCRLFRATFGQSPHDYVRERRLEAARQLLVSTSRSIGDIAMACGFSDQSHLTRCFKTHYGMPPARFRSRQLT